MARIPIKAFAYLRVSGKAQISGDGFDRQAAAIQAYARKHGYVIEDTYREKGVSGATELQDREALAAMIDQLESNGVRTVLVERADRLARDLIVSEMILNQLRAIGVAVIAVDSGTDLTGIDADPSRVLIRQVLGAVAQFEKSVIVMKLKAARDRKRRTTGRCEGRKPFGHFPGERDTLNRIFNLRTSQHLSFAVIADTLNSENRPTRQGNPWRASAVQGIIKRGRKSAK